MVMPNLARPLTETGLGRAYREAIRSLSAGSGFQPLLACYLTNQTSANELGFDQGVFQAAKWYPAHTTTNSGAGVSDYRQLFSLFEYMQGRGIPLLIHGELSDPEVDIFDREPAFIDRILGRVLADFPELPVVLEHISTKEAVAFVNEHSQYRRLGATITAHHLSLNRNDVLARGLLPHHYCRPVLQRESDRQALIRAAVSGKGPFFLGSDSAPHPIEAKECACGAAGVFSAPAALELYAEVFDQAGALERLEDFACHNGARFYQLPLNSGSIRLERKDYHLPERIQLDDGKAVHPWRGGSSVSWSIAPDEPRFGHES